MAVTHFVERLHPRRLKMIGDKLLDPRRECIRIIGRGIEAIELRQAPDNSTTGLRPSLNHVLYDAYRTLLLSHFPEAVEILPA